MNTVIITLTGPSCAGKSHLEKALVEHGIESLVSTTTRPPRFGEINGREYFFVTPQTFNNLSNTRQLVEEVEFNGNHYGVTANEVRRKAASGDGICVVVVDPAGKDQIEAYADEMNWIVYRVFVGGRAEVIAERFLKRYADEIIGAKDLRSLTTRYASRLAAMINEESLWSVDAELPGEYDLIVSDFNEETQEMVINEILSDTHKLATVGMG